MKNSMTSNRLSVFTHKRQKGLMPLTAVAPPVGGGSACGSVSPLLAAAEVQ